MQRSISTHVFLHQRLHHGHLDALLAGGASSIELFAARHHFDYTSRDVVKDIAHWFKANNVRATMHQPIYDPNSGAWSKHQQPTLNLLSPDKGSRIAAMDEIQRALEMAEQIEIDHVVLDLGTGSSRWDERTIDYSMTAIEHVKAFAHPLGAKTLLQTLNNEVATPKNLMEILRIGHFNTVGVCLDTGHVNLQGQAGVAAAFEVLGDRIWELHLHDNHGTQDEHLYPGQGTIDWAIVRDGIAKLSKPPVATLELAFDVDQAQGEVSTKSAAAFNLFT